MSETDEVERPGSEAWNVARVQAASGQLPARREGRWVGRGEIVSIYKLWVTSQTLRCAGARSGTKI